MLRISDLAQVSSRFDIGLILCFLERMGAKASWRREWHSLTDSSIHRTWQAAPVAGAR